MAPHTDVAHATKVGCPACPNPRGGTGVPAPLPLQARIRGVGVDKGGVGLFDGVSADIAAGLTWVRGGDGRGKTTLLRVIAGDERPDRGGVERLAAAVFWIDTRTAGADDPMTARQWLAVERGRFATWSDELACALIEAFNLVEHADKALYMLSAGTRRKVGLVAAFASGAPLTLLDTPMAALDARSREVVAALLEEAAGHPQRAFVVADHTLPAGLDEQRLAALIDLGD